MVRSPSGRRMGVIGSAACAATLGLLAAVSEKRSVLVLIDDAQWLDSASGEALAFAARRLRAEGIAMLWTVRTGDALSFSLDGLTELALGRPRPIGCCASSSRVRGSRRRPWTGSWT